MNDATIKEEHVIRLMNEADLYGLEVSADYLRLTASQIAVIYNGCGPDWMPEKMREVLTELLTFFEPAFMLHDVEFNFSDRSRAGFAAANERLYRNCSKLIGEKLSWWNTPVRKAVYHLRAWEIYCACRELGWSAWDVSSPA